MDKPIKKHQQPLSLDPDKAVLLQKLAESMRIPKQVLLREAIDDLLVKYKLLKVEKRPKP